MNKQQSPKVNSLPAILFWGLVWFLAASAMENPLLLPGPGEVLGCLMGLAVTADFWQITLVSIGRILLGVLGGIGLGVVLAVACAGNTWLNRLLAPALTAMQATPVASFAILVLIWLDRDYVPVLICGMMVLPVIFGSVSGGIRAADRQLLEMAAVFRLSPWSKLRRIWIPSVLPFFKAACASALSLGWKAGIAAEVLTVPKHSIGRQIADAKLYLMTEELFAWTLTVILLSLLLQKLMGRLLQGRGHHA